MKNFSQSEADGRADQKPLKRSDVSRSLSFTHISVGVNESSEKVKYFSCTPRRVLVEAVPKAAEEDARSGAALLSQAHSGRGFFESYKIFREKDFGRNANQ